MWHLLGAPAEIRCATLRVVPITTADRRDTLTETQPTKVAGTLRRAVRSQAFTRFQVDGTWNVPTTLTFVGYLRLM